MIKIIFSGLIKPPPVIKLQIQPKCKEEIIISLSSYFQKFNILISQSTQDYILYYYSIDGKEEFDPYQDNQKLQYLTNFKLKLMIFENVQKMMELKLQLSELEPQQELNNENLFISLMSEHDERMTNLQDLQIPVQSEEQKFVLDQLHNEEKKLYRQLMKFQKKFDELKKQYEQKETQDLKQQMINLNIQIEKKINVLDQLQENCLCIMNKMLSKIEGQKSEIDLLNNQRLLEQYQNNTEEIIPYKDHIEGGSEEIQEEQNQPQQEQFKDLEEQEEEKKLSIERLSQGIKSQITSEQNQMENNVEVHEQSDEIQGNQGLQQSFTKDQGNFFITNNFSPSIEENQYHSQENLEEIQEQYEPNENQSQSQGEQFKPIYRNNLEIQSYTIQEQGQFQTSVEPSDEKQGNYRQLKLNKNQGKIIIRGVQKSIFNQEETQVNQQVQGHQKVQLLQKSNQFVQKKTNQNLRKTPWNYQSNPRLRQSRNIILLQPIKKQQALPEVN